MPLGDWDTERPPPGLYLEAGSIPWFHWILKHAHELRVYHGGRRAFLDELSCEERNEVIDAMLEERVGIHVPREHGH